MKRKTVIISEDDNRKLTVTLEYDDKGKPGQNSGQLSSISNRVYEQHLEFFNPNQLKLPFYCTEVKEPIIKKKTKKGGK